MAKTCLSLLNSCPLGGNPPAPVVRHGARELELGSRILVPPPVALSLTNLKWKMKVMLELTSKGCCENEIRCDTLSVRHTSSDMGGAQ